MKKHSIFGTALVFLMLFSSGALAGTITFEGMPEAYWYYSGKQNFGTYWEGVYFGPDSTILESAKYGYNSGGYPPHSGDAVLFSIDTPYIDAIFDNPVDSVSMWYTSYSSFVLDAYDTSGNLIGTVSGGSNYGTNSFIEIEFATDIIKRLRMHDSGNYFTIDDFTADIVTGNPVQTPEPTTLLLLGFGLVGLAGTRKALKK